MPKGPKRPRRRGEAFDNPKLERFCIARANGVDLANALWFAGYKGDKRAAWQLENAHGTRSALMTVLDDGEEVSDIKLRIKELLAQGLRESEITSEVALNGLLKEAVYSDNSASRVAAYGKILEYNKVQGQDGRTLSGEQLRAMIEAAGDLKLLSLFPVLPGDTAIDITPKSKTEND